MTDKTTQDRTKMEQWGGMEERKEGKKEEREKERFVGREREMQREGQERGGKGEQMEVKRGEMRFCDVK